MIQPVQLRRAPDFVFAVSLESILNKLVLRGALLFLIAELVFALMGALVKYLSTQLPNSELVFFRNLVCLLILIPYMAARGHLKFNADKWQFHLMRSGSGISNMYLYFFCLGVLPLGETILLFQTAPIWIPFIASFWLGERFKKRYIFSAIIGFIGVALIVRPEDADFSFLILLALGGAFLSALNKCTIRRMADTESPYQVVLYFTLFSTLISIVPIFFQWQTPTLAQWPWLLLMGLMAAVGQLTMTKAFMLVSPGAIGALGYTQVVFAFTLGWLLWDETLQWSSLLGTVLIVLAGMISMGVFVRRQSMSSQYS